MGDTAASTKAPTPRPSDLLRMLGQLRGGSEADGRLGLFPALKELVRGTPGDSPLRLKDAVKSPVYRDLLQAQARTGDPAPDFELAQLDLSEGRERLTGENMRLSAHRRVSPVALIFGSYT